MRLLEVLAEVARLEDELAGKRAKQRSAMRRKCLQGGANILCPCGQILTVVEELDDHLDHMIEESEA